MAAALVAPTLTRIMRGSSADMVAHLLRVLLPDARTALDMTWGRGGFWKYSTARVAETGLDLSPHGRPDVVGDFTRLPFRDGSFDVAVFDPPYVTEAGKDGVIGKRFGSYATMADLEAAVRAGSAEAWRIARVGVIVKVMDYCHASRLVRMSRWVEETIPVELFDVAYLESPAKVEDPKWSRRGSQLSVRSTATTWLVWRKDGPVHKRRTLAPALTVPGSGVEEGR